MNFEKVISIEDAKKLEEENAQKVLKNILNNIPRLIHKSRTNPGGPSKWIQIDFVNLDYYSKSQKNIILNGLKKKGYKYSVKYGISMYIRDPDYDYRECIII